MFLNMFCTDAFALSISYAIKKKRTTYILTSFKRLYTRPQSLHVNKLCIVRKLRFRGFKWHKYILIGYRRMNWPSVIKQNSPLSESVISRNKFFNAWKRFYINREKISWACISCRYYCSRKSRSTLKDISECVKISRISLLKRGMSQFLRFHALCMTFRLCLRSAVQLLILYFFVKPAKGIKNF